MTASGVLNGKVTLISGTAGGQGRAAALAFARQGAKVVGCDINAAGAAETTALATKEGGTMISVHPLDVSEPADAEKWVKAAIDKWGKVDVLYNNAGALKAKGPLATSTLEEWNLTLKYELTIVYVSTMAAWPHLVAGGGGVIINTASASGHKELLPMRSAAHGATKAGVLGLTRMMAAEGAAHKIRAVSISPGMIRTPAIERFFTGENPAQTAIGEGLIRKIPMGRYGTCEEVAEAAVFLASNAASYINGADICIDGGLTNIAYP